MAEMTPAEIIAAFKEGIISKFEARDSLGFGGAVPLSGTAADGDPAEPAPMPGTTAAPAPAQFVPQQVVAPQSAQPTPICPVHHGSRFVPAGVSKKSGKAYESFWSCTERECSWKA
jgi:hypothetical protein